jgi:predicted phosphodiesterase
VRTAIISDIHGNLVSLEAVLDDASRQAVDRFVCLGDVAATGPQPRAAVLRIAELGCPVVMGNTDHWLLEPGPPPSEGEDEMRIHDIDLWCREQLGPTERAALARYQPVVELDGLCCYHGSPRSFDQELLPATAVVDLSAALAGHSADIYAGGHTHQVMLRRHQTALVINPGSVGMPFELLSDGSFRNPPVAEYAIVDGRNVEFRRVPVNVAAVTTAAMRTDMPHSGWWVRDWAWSQ